MIFFLCVNAGKYLTCLNHIIYSIVCQVRVLLEYVVLFAAIYPQVQRLIISNRVASQTVTTN